MLKLGASTNHLLHIFLSLFVLVLSVSIFSKINQQPLPDNAQAIVTGKAIYSDQQTPPPVSADWEDISLPDDWFRQTEINQNKWYQFELSTSELLNEPLALYLTNATNPATLYINHQLIFKPEPKLAETARTWAQPQFIKLESNNVIQALNSSVTNEINDKKLILNIMLPKNKSASGLLGPVYIGPKKSIFDAYEETYFIKVTLVSLIVFTMILSSFFVGMLWLFRRRDTVYAFYAVAVLIWAIYSYGSMPLNLPFPSQTWEWIRLSAMVWWSISISFFCNRFLDSPQPRIEIVLFLQAMLISIMLTLVDESTLYWCGDFIFPAYATLLGLYPSYRMLTEAAKRKDPQLTWLTMCGIMVMLVATHDIVLYAHWVPPWNGLYLHYVALILLVVFNIILLKRFVGTLNQVESLNKNLEEIVAIKAQKLEKNYQQLSALKHEKILTIERERIMRDMHDGVGGTLVSMRSALDRGSWTEQDMFEGLGSALDDLYMMIHSLDPYGSDLAIALGSIRHLLENRLRRANIELRWVVKALPEIENLSPAIVLSVMRIMQEAITNVIKHSNASHVQICIPFDREKQTAPMTCLSITDNGQGFNLQGINCQEKGQTGLGLSGMQYRAEKISAKLSFISAKPGTQILLQLPISKTSPSLI